MTAELGYAPRGGPGPERGAGSVNLVVGETNNAYFTEIIRNVEQTLERAGLSMVLTATHDEARRHWRCGWLGWSSTDGRRDPGAP